MGNTTRDRERASRMRLQLIIDMGGKCVLCGSIHKLEFDHPNGRDWQPSHYSRWTRMKLYRQDWERGNLRLLCEYCNRKDGNSRRWKNFWIKRGGRTYEKDGYES